MDFQEDILIDLHKIGWKEKPIGFYRSSGEIKEINHWKLFVRETSFGDFLKKSPNPNIQKVAESLVNTRLSAAGSKDPMGSPEAFSTPQTGTAIAVPEASRRNSSNLPELANFSNYPSLVSTRPDKPCLLIGFDSEWQNLEIGRDMLSWQYAFIWNDILYEFLFFKNYDKDLNFNIALGCILDYINIKPTDLRNVQRYQYCSEWKNDNTPLIKTTANVNEARKNCKYVFRDGEFTHELISEQVDKDLPRGQRSWSWFKNYNDFSNIESIKVTLLCHAGKVDLSGLNYDRDKFILKYLTDVQGGLVSLQPIRLVPKSLQNVSHCSVFPVSLSISDTMCHAPAGLKKLENLGQVVGIEKIDISTEQKEHMLELLNNDPITYFEYASTDSVVTLMYASSMYGYNNSLPVTVTSATATVMKEVMMKKLNCEDTKEFNRKYRGLQTVSHGLLPREDRPGYIETTSLEPLNDTVSIIQNQASHAYHGGYNSCSEIGYFAFDTHDYDLQNAYPTAMCLVPDIDWTNPCRVEIQRRNLTLNDWVGIGGINPITPFVGYVSFEFPKAVKYPCIPVNVDGIPVYPRTSKCLDGVYVAGPFIYLALKLGATVYCERGFFLNTLYNDDYTQESKSLAVAVKQLVEDRNQAKADCGKKSLEELILKTMVNSGYGKNAQNVVVKSHWTAFKDLMEDLGCSAITNPVSAMMITSIVQCELLAAQNQMNELGYISCSVTTDGFISDCPEDVLQNLDLYGFKKFIEQSRIYLTGKPELWEAKHHQNDLINFTTRGNVSLLSNGVCAHNSTKSGYVPDSYEDRLWLMTQVLSREGTVDYTDYEWTSFKDIVHGQPFIVKSVTRHIRMDFDLKRKPDRNSFRTDRPVVEGVQYEIAHFDTVPYEDVAEFRLYREKKKLTSVLRTELDWEIFFCKIDMNAVGKRITINKEWSILTSCIMGHRAGLWNIPALEYGTIEDKCHLINEHNNSGKEFKVSDWKNARRPERIVNMLPRDMIKDKLEEFMNITNITYNEPQK